MPPDCTEAAILTFTSKLGQFIGLNRHILFLYDVSVRMRIYFGILLVGYLSLQT